MKATILVRDLVKLIAKHGDLDVRMCIDSDLTGEHEADVKCADEVKSRVKHGDIVAFEIYGEEQ